MDSIKSYLATQLPGYDFMPALLESEAEYYANNKQWPQCEEATYLILRKYGAQLPDEGLNGYAWDYIFLHGNRKDVLEETLKLLKISVDRSTHGDILDTYANLLYKSGRTKEALEWENKALAVARQKKSIDDEKDVQATLAKMAEGVPTWIDAH